MTCTFDEPSENLTPTDARWQGKYDQVGQLYARAVDISQASLGTFHPQVAVVLGNLAAFFEKMVRKCCPIALLESCP